MVVGNVTSKVATLEKQHSFQIVMFSCVHEFLIVQHKPQTAIYDQLQSTDIM